LLYPGSLAARWPYNYDMQRRLVPLLVSDFLTVLSLMMGHVAIPWWIVTEGGAQDLAIFAAFGAASAVFSTALLSPLADRYEKRSVIFFGLLVLTACSAGPVVLAAFGMYDIRALTLLQIAAGISSGAVSPAMLTIASELVPAANLSKAVAMQQSAQSTGRLVGPLIAAALLASFGTTVALVAHSLLLLVAVIAAKALPRPTTLRNCTVSGSWLRDIRAAAAVIWAIPLERGWTLATFFSWMFVFPGITIFVPLKVQAMGLGPTWVGIAEAGLSVGVLSGALGGAAVLIKRLGRYQARMSAAVIQGASLILAGLATNPWLFAASLLLTGLSLSVSALAGSAHRTLARPPAFRARMSSLTILSFQVAASVGPVIAGACLARWSISVVYVGFGVLAGSFAFFLLVVPRFREFMGLSHEHVEGWYERSYPHVFSAVVGSREHGAAAKGSS